MILRGHLVRDPGGGVDRAAQGRDAGPGAVPEPRPLRAVVRGMRVGVHLRGRRRQPRVVQQVVLRRGAEVPDDRVGVAGQQREPDQLVHRPRADVGRGHVADVGEVERQHGAELGAVQLRLAGGQPLLAEPVEPTRSSQSTALVPNVAVFMEADAFLSRAAALRSRGRGRSDVTARSRLRRRRTRPVV